MGKERKDVGAQGNSREHGEQGVDKQALVVPEKAEPDRGAECCNGREAGRAAHGLDNGTQGAAFINQTAESHALHSIYIKASPNLNAVLRYGVKIAGFRPASGARY